MKSLILKKIVSVCESEPEAILIFEKIPSVAEIIKKFRIRYIPIISQVELGEMEGVFNLPTTHPENFLISLLEALTWERERNPLTGLPGNEAINREIEFKILNQNGYWLSYVDLNDFKFFNDQYGFEMGDRLIFHTARIIKDNAGNNFVGHIGGDDFVFIIPQNNSEILDSICREFDDSLKYFYPEGDRDREEFQGIDRFGRDYKFGHVHLAIVVLTKRYENLKKLNYATAYLKKISKQRSKIEKRSLWLSDNTVAIGHRDDLLRILQGNDRTAKRAAIEVLGEIAEPDNLDLFVELLRNKDFLIRKSAVYALGKIGKSEILPYILNTLNDPSPHVRMRAAEALGYFYRDAVADILVNLLNDPDCYVRIAAINSIGRLKLKSAIPRLIKTNDERIIPSILRVLAELGDDSALDFIQAKLNKNRFSALAIDALGRIYSSRSLAILFDVLSSRNFAQHRHRIYRAIYNLSRMESLKEIIKANIGLIYDGLRDSKPYYVIMTLYEIGDDTRGDEVKKFLYGKDIFMRRAAILYLSNNKKNLKVLADILLQDPLPSIRQTAADILAKFGKAALPYLRKALKDRDFSTRQSVIRSIMAILF